MDQQKFHPTVRLQQPSNIKAMEKNIAIWADDDEKMKRIRMRELA